MHTQHPKPIGRKSDSGFTLLEIAVSLAVIGFAVVAVLGVMPTGLNIQRDTRERTIVTQDAMYWMDAIKRGVEITDSSATNVATSVDFVSYVANFNGMNIRTTYVSRAEYPNDGELIRRLSHPIPQRWGSNSRFYSQIVTKAMSGSAMEKGGASDQGRIVFRYAMTSEVLPVSTVEDAGILTNETLDFRDRAYRESQLLSLSNNLHEVRLTFVWPVQMTADGRRIRQVGPNQMEFRTYLTGALTSNNRRVPGLSTAWSHPDMADDTVRRLTVNQRVLR